MKIMIEFDPTTATAKVTSPTSVEGGVITQAAAGLFVQGAVQDAGAYSGVAPEQGTFAVTPQVPDSGSAVQDAGAYSGVAPEQGTFAVTPQVLGARIATATGSPPPPHPDTFGLRSGGIRSGEGLDAGTPKG